MSWNYRIVRYREGDPKFTPYTHGIHEVFYAEDGSVNGWTEDAISLLGFDRDDLEWRLRMMSEAFTKTVLDYEPTGDAPKPL